MTLSGWRMYGFPPRSNCPAWRFVASTSILFRSSPLFMGHLLVVCISAVKGQTSGAMANHGPTPPQQFGGKPAQPKTPKNTGVAQGQIQNWEDLSHILPEGGVQQGFQLRHETGEEPG